ncbi:MAG: DUF2339 domain-containing protein [Candidatus Eisenbacteria bacterium]|uniref:DUF2339 domain-containing protein n=1 Tax=Eiseniibacteriota bacterium TaxID=2212470 RepID=A0A956LXQ6_UNCEI|nr:DUF2339 domain-containing protein [Candidatus Eisenbacteria bacterium]
MPFLVMFGVAILLAGPVALVLALVFIPRVQRLEAEISALRTTLRAQRDALRALTGEAETDAVRTTTTSSSGAEVGESAPDPSGVPGVPTAAALPVTAGDPETPPTIAPGAAPRGAPPAAPAGTPPATPSTASADPARHAKTQHTGTTDLESLIGGQWLTWIGVLAIFFGTAFFLGIDLGAHPLAGLGQVVIGGAVASAFLGIGAALQGRRQRVLAQGLLGGGVALLFLAAYATTIFHELAPKEAIYALLTAVSVGGALLAIRMSSPTVAGLTLIGALLTPFFLELAGRAALQILPYLFVVNLGAAVVAARRDWRGLPLGAFLGSVILLAMVATETHSEPEVRTPLLAGAGSIWLLYVVLPLVSRPGERFWSAARGVLIFLDAGAFVFFLYHWLAPDFTAFRGASTMALGVLYVATGVLAERPRNLPLARITRYAGIALLCVAVPLQLDLGSVTFAWAVLGALLVELGTRREDGGYRVLGAITLAGDIVHAILGALFDWHGLDWMRPVVNASFLGNVALTAAMGHLSWRLRRAEDRPHERALATPVLLATLVLLWLVITIETVHGFDLAGSGGSRSLRLAANLTLSVFWAIYGGLLIGGGFVFRFRPVRLLGFSVIAVLVFKVFLLDIQDLERGYRIASFVAVGVLLLLVSILYQRGRQRAGDGHDPDPR